MILDLHGVRHILVSGLVEDFIFNNSTPFYIITGNSNRMKSLVIEVLEQHNFKYFISTENLGQIVITE